MGRGMGREMRVEKKKQIKKEETRGEAGRRSNKKRMGRRRGRDTRTRVCSPDDVVAGLRSWALSVERHGPPSVSQRSRSPCECHARLLRLLFKAVAPLLFAASSLLAVAEARDRSSSIRGTSSWALRALAWVPKAAADVTDDVWMLQESPDS
jgi:hypothetical protein